MDLTEGMKKVLGGVLKTPLPQPDMSGHEAKQLQPVDMAAREQREHLGREVYDEAEEAQSQQRGAPCAQQ